MQTSSKGEIVSYRDGHLDTAFLIISPISLSLLCLSVLSFPSLLCLSFLTPLRYHNGNDETVEGMIRGFGHTGFLCDDLDSACVFLEEQGVAFKKKPAEGTMRGTYSTVQYSVE
jgi:hypothetical protein